MTENCRVKTARFLDLTFLPIEPAFAFFSAFALAGAIRVTMICSRRSAMVAASAESAKRSPLTVCPARVRPVNAKLGIDLPSHCSNRANVRGLPMPAPATTPTPR